MLSYLIKALDTNDLKEVIGHLSLSPLDIDLLLYEAQEKGEIEIDKEKARITVLTDPTPYYDVALADKLVKTMNYYDKQGANITRNRLEQNALDLAGKHGCPIHDFVCTLYALEQGDVAGMPKVYKYEISVPEIKDKRPANTFVFYTLLDHQEYGASAVNDFIDQWDKKEVK